MRKLIALLVFIVVLGLKMPAGAQVDGYPRGVLIIPSIRLVEPVHAAPLVDRAYAMPGSGVVWLEGTAWVDLDWARVVLAGHTPGAFARLTELRAGDWIMIISPQGSAAYRVAGLHIAMPDDTSWLMPTEQPTLALVTCMADEKYRLIVAAERAR